MAFKYLRNCILYDNDLIDVGEWFVLYDWYYFILEASLRLVAFVFVLKLKLEQLLTCMFYHVLSEDYS